MTSPTLPFRRSPVALSLSLLIGALGCGGDSSSAEDSSSVSSGDIIGFDSTDGPKSDAVSADADGGQSTNGGDPLCPDEGNLLGDYWVLYGLRGRVDGVNLGQSELFLMTPEGGNPIDLSDPEPLSITEFALTGAEHQWCPDSEPWPLTCQYGCFIDDALDWIAIALPVPSPNAVDPEHEDFDTSLSCLLGEEGEEKEVPDASLGSTVWLGQLDVSLKAKMIKGVFKKNLAHFTFAGGKMYYSKRAGTVGPSNWYDIYRVDLEKNVNEDVKLVQFPPQEALGDSIYKGYFKVSEDGDMISFLNPTIRSQSYWVWEGGTLHYLNLLCQNRQNEKCIGTGSHYLDRDPVAISPDNSELVTFTIAESHQRAWKYKTKQEAEPLWTNVVTTPPGTDYWTSACKSMTESWQYEKVFSMQFGPEGDSVLYLGASPGPECTQIGFKTPTDILEMPVDLIGSGKPLEEGDIINISRNPKNNTAANIEIGNFDLCPDGAVMAMFGTPSVDLQGKPLQASNQVTLDDKELYLMSRDGCIKKQMTKDVLWEVNSVRCMPPKAITPPGG